MSNHLKIIHLNIQSIDSETKKLQLTRLAQIHKTDIISINETFLKPNKNLEIDGYSIIRSDRQLPKKGGGAALCIKNNLVFQEIDLSSVKKFDEATGVLLSIDDHLKIAIFSIYSSPSNPLNLDLLEYIEKNYKNFIITGDFNAKSKLWFCEKDYPKGILLENFSIATKSQILNCQSPTYERGKSVLDLSICSNSVFKFFKKHQVLKSKISDHQPTITVFSNLKPKRKTHTAKRIDWNLFRENLDQNLPNGLFIENENDIQCESIELISKLNQAINSSTTSKTFVTKAINPITIPFSLVKLIKLKRKIKRWLNKKRTEYTTRLYNLLNYNIKKRIKKLREERLTSEFEKLGNFNQSESKSWKLIKKLENVENDNSSRKMIHLKKPDNTMTKSDKEVAETFGINLKSVFSENRVPNSNIPLVATRLDTKNKENINITKEEFLSTLSTTNASAAPGVDGINNKIFKNCPTSFLIRIFKLFNATLRIGYIPKEWKMAKIVMIPKKDKPPELAESYRPISLLSCLSKWLEKIVNEKLLSWLESKNLLPPCQSGFRKKKKHSRPLLKTVPFDNRRF